MKSTSNFQIIVLGLFIFFIILGIVAFATFKGSSNSTTELPSITLWGTFPKSIFDNYLAKVNQSLESQLKINYIQKSSASFSQEFIAALARGNGPDGILVPVDILLPHLDKITPIPFKASPQRDFMNTYIQEGEIYLGSAGVRALPFAVDPLVMYWNRDTYAAAGFSTYPRVWDEFTGLNQKITKLDQNNNFIRSTAIAMGDFTNVQNAREILASLFFQTGNPITKDKGVGMQSVLTQDQNIVSAVNFFAQFINPNDKNYSWNRSMPDSKTAFIAGVLATYFGFASEIFDIRSKNPNLNFDVAPLPQYKSGGQKSVYGKMYGLSIVKASPNQNGAYQIFAILTSPQFMSGLSDALYLPSVRRDVIAAGSSDPYISVFNEQALISKAWFDVDPSQSANLFSEMINSISSGVKTTREAISDTSDKYDVLLRQAVQ